MEGMERIKREVSVLEDFERKYAFLSSIGVKIIKPKNNDFSQIEGWNTLFPAISALFVTPVYWLIKKLAGIFSLSLPILIWYTSEFSMKTKVIVK